MKWVKGPLGYTSTEDWKYWIPSIDGMYKPTYHPKGIPTSEAFVLGRTQTEEEAKRLCEEHARELKCTAHGLNPCSWCFSKDRRDR